jgi:tetratricopeptide (TPR) repeat protein
VHVPGWHEATKTLQERGRLRMVGIVQEQHPERARLFMQWKRMTWPILTDPLDLLGVSVVPVTVAIDEHGIVRAIDPRPERIQEEFLEKRYEPPPAGDDGGAAGPPDLERLREAAAGAGSAAGWRAYADALFLWGGGARLDEAIGAYERAIEKDPGDAPSRFRLGVALRARYDSQRRRGNDFQRAVAVWERALDIDPNNYIWRRRIQQYGPRLEKPYPFYDWVDTARHEIQARGETPAPLTVEPGGAELAPAASTFEGPAVLAKEPDPGGRIHRDPGTFVKVEATVVPTTVRPGGAARVHLDFRPNVEKKAHWNNEVADLGVWVAPPAGWQVDERSLSAPRPPQAVSEETRRVELELRIPEDAKAGASMLPAYALYYVCEDVRGARLYRRQDLDIQVQVRK